ncbi:MAG: hypothetical protein AAF787_09805 [Chloroflexota bacterium]
MTFGELILQVRERLLQAHEGNDAHSLDEMATILTLFQDFFESQLEWKKAAIAQDLKLATFDALNGTPWKSELPAIEHIEQVFGDET